MPHEDEGRNLGNASTSQEIAKIASKPPEVERDMGQIFPHISQQESTLITL